MLNEEQQKMCADNHPLIYWYMNMNRLDEEEWYGLIAIGLCTAVENYSDSNVPFASYFKVICDNMVINERVKQSRDKRTATLVELNHDTMNGHANEFRISGERCSEVECDIILKDMVHDVIDDENREIIKLKGRGLTQVEISERLGISQGQISKILKKTKERFLND